MAVHARSTRLRGPGTIGRPTRRPARRHGRRRRAAGRRRPVDAVGRRRRPGRHACCAPVDRVSALALRAAPPAHVVDGRREDAAADRAGRRRPCAAQARRRRYGHLVVDVGAARRGRRRARPRRLGHARRQRRVVVGDGAQLTLVSRAATGPTTRCTCAAHHGPGRPRRHGRATSVVTLGGDLVRRTARRVDYAGPGGDAELLGLYFADAGQHLEHRLLRRPRRAALPQQRDLQGRAAGRGRAHGLDRRRADPGRRDRAPTPTR